MQTQYHAKYLAYELTKRLPAEKAEKLSQSLANATVDLNPHQVETALFKFRSPLSRPETKIALQKHAGELERQRNAKRKNLFEAQDRIAADKDKLLDEVAAKLKQQVTETEVFTNRWKVK